MNGEEGGGREEEWEEGRREGRERRREMNGSKRESMKG